ncbi:MAG: hypothetical protein ACLU0T_05905 [Bacteroidales bacterium]
MSEIEEESRKETNVALVKRVAGTIGVVIGLLAFLVIGIAFVLFVLRVNPLFRFELEALLGGPIGQIMFSASDALFGWIW